MNDDQRFPSRRHILTSGAFAATGLVLAKGAFAQPGLAPTPSCHDGDEATIPEIEGPFLDQMPLHRWVTVDEVAAPIAFLLSDDASMISGVSLPIDGGYTCHVSIPDTSANA